MATIQLLPGSREEIGSLLQDSARAKECAIEIVDRYVNAGPSLDSTLPPLRPHLHQASDRNQPPDSQAPNDTNHLQILQQQADAKRDSFLEALKCYEAEAHEKYKTGINVEQTYTMKQVWDELDDAIEQYQNKGTKGFIGRVRGLGRKLGKHGEAVEGWLGLLPTSSQYLSAVLGGLRLIIKASSKIRGITDEIMGAIHEIPHIFDNTKRAEALYQSENLKAITWEMYTLMVTALGYILEFLRRSLCRKSFKALLQQSSFGAELKEKIRAVKDCKARFDSEVDMCEKEMVGRIDNRSKAIEDTVNERSHEILISLDHLGQMVMEFLHGNPAVPDLTYELRKRLDTPSISTAACGYGPSSEELRHKLLSRLKYDPEAAGIDVIANYKLATRLDREDQERSLYVIKSPKLASWVTTKNSASLIIQGNAPTVARQSALSFVCARLVHALDETKQKNDDRGKARADAIPLHFFCGEHAKVHNTRETPSGVVNSLLAQLLTQCKDVHLNTAIGCEAFDSSRLKSVFKRFKYVLAQLPRTTTVFCIVDGLSFYVDNAITAHDAKWLIKKLLRLVYSKSRDGPLLKVLLTAPNNMHASEVDILSDNEVLHVPRSLPHTGGFTGTKWDLTMERHLHGRR